MDNLRDTSFMGAVQFLAIAGLLLAVSVGLCAKDSGKRASANKTPQVEDYATIEAYVGKDEIPVYAFGYTHVYGVSADLLPGAVMQEGNSNPIVKFNPKKSWEIKDNLCGSTPDSAPTTMWNDDQPLLPVHLIDGDSETAWSSRGGTAPDRQPEWIRIDLPAESTVASVALVCSQKGPGMGTGKQLPKELTVKLSRDARQWDTVYENKNFSGQNAGPTVISFDPRRAKQIWIIANNLPRLQWGHAISIGEVEVRDQEGNNLALLSRGAGVQVSSTYYGYEMDRFTHDMLWPIQYDLGFKWTRVGYDSGKFLWSYVEREKGVLRIDPKADAAITDAVRNGMNVILCLDKGNWLYHDPPRKVDWKKSRVREMMHTYYDHQGWPSDSPELMAGYLKYVDYMVRHFKGRVAYYEICNEWHPISVEDYVRIVKATIPVIKKADPKAKIMLGSTGGLNRTRILAVLGKEPELGIRDGKLLVPDGTIFIAKTEKFGDAEVSVAAKSNAEAGIVLRYQDSRNYVAAMYAPQWKSVYFHEVINGNPGPGINHVTVPDTIGLDVQLVATVNGPKATLEMTDGSNAYSTSLEIKSPALLEAGQVGLMHNNYPVQMFDDFRVTDLQGKKLFEDRFNRANGKPDGWTQVSGDGWVKVEKGIGPQLDAIGWHPFYQTDPDSPSYRSYRKDVEEFRKEVAEYGFKGQFAATEWTWAAPYPGASDWCSEMQKAKYSAQLMTAHCGMDIISLYNETYQTGKIDWDCNLLRNAFSVDPISATQPQPIYYVLRNISTVMDGFKAAQFTVKFSADRQFDCYTFRSGENDLMLAVWIPGRTKDGIVEIKSDVILPGLKVARASVADVFNGTEQGLIVSGSGDGAIIRGMLIKDYPVFIKLVTR